MWLSEFLGNKLFINMERSEILSFLTKLKKSIAEDPKQKLIGSYNIRQLIIVSLNGYLILLNKIIN